MKTKSAKAKGNRFENYLVSVLKENLDAKTHRNYASGSGLDKNDIRIPSFDIEIEAKNAKRVNLIKDWEQAKRQETASKVILAVRNPKKPEFDEVLIVIDLFDFIEILKKQKGKDEVETLASKN
ncbi:MAG: hypothetical protein ABIM64_05515, partial [candidate division WOR-3 bacterium]